MKFYNLNTYYVVTKIKEHQQNKMNLLSLMNSLPLSKINTDVDKICKTDWNLPKETKRDYIDLFISMISPYMDEMAKKMKFNKWNIDNVWFQMYGKNNTHNWHVHNYANWTNVYYLHLPNKELKTEIYDVKNENIIDNIKVNEGEIVTFPAGMLHRSPVNNTDELKAVIAFNSNFDDLALTI